MNLRRNKEELFKQIKKCFEKNTLKFIATDTFKFYTVICNKKQINNLKLHAYYKHYNLFLLDDYLFYKTEDNKVIMQELDFDYAISKGDLLLLVNHYTKLFLTSLKISIPIYENGALKTQSILGLDFNYDEHLYVYDLIIDDTLIYNGLGNYIHVLGIDVTDKVKRFIKNSNKFSTLSLHTYKSIPVLFLNYSTLQYEYSLKISI